MEARLKTKTNPRFIGGPWPRIVKVTRPLRKNLFWSGGGIDERSVRLRARAACRASANELVQFFARRHCLPRWEATRACLGIGGSTPHYGFDLGSVYAAIAITIRPASRGRFSAAV